jgi:enoyl-[acyl-carrier-protein] reductase (NADH)
MPARFGVSCIEHQKFAAAVRSGAPAEIPLEVSLRTPARKLGPRNIRVNAVVLGAIVNERQSALHRDAAADQVFLDAQCLKIRLDAGHAARATLFLASDDADGMTGQRVLVDASIAQQSVRS